MAAADRGRKQEGHALSLAVVPSDDQGFRISVHLSAYRHLFRNFSFFASGFFQEASL